MRSAAAQTRTSNEATTMKPDTHAAPLAADSIDTADSGAEERQRPLPSPAKLRRDFPLSPTGRETVRRGRAAIADILTGRDAARLLIVCGPCSIDDVNSALVYAGRLKKLADRVADKAVLVMRTYFEKPRSVVGWKGLLYEPLDGTAWTPASGLTLARRLAARINESGLPCATEFLNPLLALYLEDLFAYGSIGSRTVESQVHRELASRLALPMGLKNGMDGDAASALNAQRSAAAAHRFFGTTLSGDPCLLESPGNPLAHVILRGGAAGPNFDACSVEQAATRATRPGLLRPVLVDCSHGNSGKDHHRQPTVAREVVRQVRAGQRGIAGIMLESYLVEGRQDAEADAARRFGQSITDSCIGWTDTEDLILEIADKR